MLQGRLYAFEAFHDGAEDVSRTRRADYYALVLDPPSCVAGGGKLVIVELAAPARRLKSHLGARVSATGILTQATADDAQTELVMKVKALRAAPAQ